MTEKIPVAIVTYRRPEYLKQTLDSFIDLNGAERFKFLILSQATEADTVKVINLYDDYLFYTELSNENLGCSGGYSHIMQKALQLKTPYLLFLQDDWESQESLLPYLDEILGLLKVSPDVGYVRLRTIKSRVCRTNRITSKPIKYKERTDHVMVGNAHFTLNPSIAKNSVITRMLPVFKELNAMEKYHKLGLLTGQLRAKCFVHIGSKRAMTQIPGRRKRIWIK